MPERLPRLYLISDAARLGDDLFVERAAAAASAGLAMVLVREPGVSPQRRAALLERLHRELPETVILLLSTYPGESPSLVTPLAGPAGARGVHLGRCSPEAIRQARRALPEGHLLGYSAHCVMEANEALAQGADYVSFSPVFAPLSKATALRPHGLEGLRRACSAIDGPVFALGGITVERARQVREAGAHGAAVIGAIVDASDPASVTRRLLGNLS